MSCDTKYMGSAGLGYKGCSDALSTPGPNLAHRRSWSAPRRAAAAAHPARRAATSAAPRRRLRSRIAFIRSAGDARRRCCAMLDIAISRAISYIQCVRLVFDTDVMVAAIRSDAGASRQLLIAGLRQQCQLLVSVPLVMEYEAVMTRPEHLEAARLSADDVSALLDAVVRVAEPIRLAFLWRPELRDPNDDMVLETAVNGAADRLVTFNRSDYRAAGSHFRIVVCSPGEALGALKGRS